MKVFISHSWHNKMKAQMLYKAIRDFGATPWMDAEQILPGEHIDSKIESEMPDAGLVLLVWSAQSAASAAVQGEIRLATRLEKTILPFLIDKTPIPENSALKGLKFIDGTENWEVAEGQLKFIILHHMMRYFKMDDSEMSKSMREFQGSIETVGQLVSKYDLKGKGSEEEKDFWEKEILENEASAEKKIRPELEIGAESQLFLKEIMADLEKAGNNKAQNLAVWEKAKAYKYADHPSMRVVMEQIKKVVDAATGEETSTPRMDKSDVMQKIILRYREEIGQKLLSSYPEFKKRFAPLVPDFIFRPVYDQNSYFFSRSVEHLEMLYALSLKEGTHPMVKDAVSELCSYLSNPAGILHNDQYGILGYTDDAYLILWVLEVLARKGLVDYSNWGTDWLRLNATAERILSVYGPEVRNQMNASVENLFAALDAKYQTEQPLNSNQVDEARAQLQREKEALFQSRIQGLLNQL